MKISNPLKQIIAIIAGIIILCILILTIGKQKHTLHTDHGCSDYGKIHNIETEYLLFKSACYKKTKSGTMEKVYE